MTWIAVWDQGRRKRLWIKESPVVRLAAIMQRFERFSSLPTAFA
jgi:hypothetical protein